MRTAAITAGLLGFLGIACARSSSAGRAEGGATSALAIRRPASAAPGDPQPRPLPASDRAWVQAMRLQRWREAARLIDALPEQRKKDPKVRYARARAAAELGDPKVTVKMLDGLDKKLPTLAAEIARERAEAELTVGPFDDAARYFAREGDAASLVAEATALFRAHQVDKARVAVARAIARLGAHDDLELQVKARALRAQLDSKHAARDLRWIALQAPESAEAKGIGAKLQKLGRPLTAAEHFRRAVELSKAGRVAETDYELELAGHSKHLQPADVLSTRAWARYNARSDYLKAAELFEKAVRLGGADAPKNAFYAARARSRANQDARASVQYRAMARRYPRSGYAREARYLAARLSYIDGKWSEAIAGYTQYLKRYRGGRYRRGAEYERAVAELAAGRFRPAARTFGKLAGAADARNAGRYRELEGVALARAGDKAQAAQRFTRVIEERPLSFSALAAGVRLARVASDPPPMILPAPKKPAPPPLRIQLPKKVQLLISMGLDGDAEAELHAQESTFEKAYGARGSEALCQAYAELSTAAQRYRVAQHAVRASALETAPSAATRWAWNCIYPEPYAPLVGAAEDKWKLPHDLLYAVMRQESGFRPAVVSSANAIGLLQLLPVTAGRIAADLGLDYHRGSLDSPPDNIRLGAAYLNKLLGAFGGSVALAAAAYNAGPDAVARWLASGHALSLDVFVARIPYGETRNYVYRVVGNLARYAFLDGGEAAVPKLSLDVPDDLHVPSDVY